MNILHLFSANFFSGAVAYAIAVAKQQQQDGHQIYLASDKFDLKENLQYVEIPIHKRSLLQRIKNILAIKKIIKEKHIDIIHAHSRAASWVAYFATFGTKTALVSTIHGRQKAHSKRKNRIYGEKIIAVCQNLQKHLTEEVQIPANQIYLIPNAICFEKNTENLRQKDSQNIKICYITRFNGGKGKRLGELLENVFPYLLEKYSISIELIGGKIEELEPVFQEKLKNMMKKYPDKIQLLGFVHNISDYIQKADLVMGGGRVAIEALFAQKTVFALGEVNFEGLVTTQNLNTQMESNFGDMMPFENEQKTWDFEKIKQEFINFIENENIIDNKNKQTIQKIIFEWYNMKSVSEKIYQIYQSTRMKKLFPKHIPALMYHKIPDEAFETKHQIYITKDNFKIHLDFFKKNGFSPITFKFYNEIAEGKRKASEMPKKPIFLTFDDGYLDNYTNLLPLMQTYGYVGTIFLLGDFSVHYNFWDADKGEHRDELMNEAQKKAFFEAGWEIGVHTLRHANLREVNLETATHEIEVSKQNLENFLGEKLVSFAYPYGALNENVKKLVKDSGFLFGVSTDSGGLHLEDDRMEIFRVNIFPDDKEAQLRKKTSSWYRIYYKWKRKK